MMMQSAVVTFETAQLEQTLQLLKVTEKAVAPGSGLVSQLKSKLKGTEQLQEAEVVELLERQIVVADCQVCAAVLNFLQQDLGSCVKGSWGLRRAWKTYDRIYGQISAMYRQVQQEVPVDARSRRKLCAPSWAPCRWATVCSSSACLTAAVQVRQGGPAAGRFQSDRSAALAALMPAWPPPSILLRETAGRYGQAALFQFFRGRVLRPAGWCRLMQLDWVGAFVAFSELAQQSRWSRAFYHYLAAGERHYRRALVLGRDDRSRPHVAPHASYELAVMYCGDSRRTTDFESRLGVRIQSALKRLEKVTREERAK
ncbi:tetratricopeptide repeat protein 39C-like [Pollicipes pollicipes]|uniref:tetratricopeptide repeat protein 39C-like n=1 Tax=Pollicipes pollicipes TaxID=41117 RepID=UPI001884B643|nr:tetratricopeptide repeat protein 39C-like [Pollicipes pollicipes]